MINLAGNKDCDEYIKREFRHARIKAVEMSAPCRGEVACRIYGELKGFVFIRAWYYSMVAFMGIQSWGHLAPAVYKELDVTKIEHPKHREFLGVMRKRTTGTRKDDNIFEAFTGEPPYRFLSPHVKLGNLLRFVGEE